MEGGTWISCSANSLSLLSEHKASSSEVLAERSTRHISADAKYPGGIQTRSGLIKHWSDDHLPCQSYYLVCVRYREFGS